jgi:hypothetical protein
MMSDDEIAEESLSFLAETCPARPRSEIQQLLKEQQGNVQVIYPSPAASSVTQRRRKRSISS